MFNLFRLQRLVFLAFLISFQTPAGQELLECPTWLSCRNPTNLTFVCFFGLGVVWGFGQLPCVGPNKFRVIKVYQVQHGPSWWADVSGDFTVTGTKSDAAAKRVRHLTAGRRGASRSKYLPGCQCGAIYIWLYLHTYLCHIIVMLYIHIYKTYIFIDYTLCKAQVN